MKISTKLKICNIAKMTTYVGVICWAASVITNWLIGVDTYTVDSWITFIMTLGLAVHFMESSDVIDELVAERENDND